MKIGFCNYCEGQFHKKRKESKFCSEICYYKSKPDKCSGENNPMFGVIRSGEKAANWKGGIPPCLDCGKKITRGYKRCKSCSHKLLTGNKSNKWKGGVTPLKIMIRNTQNYKKWVLSVFKRDGFRCQSCFVLGSGNLQAHHKKQFSILITEFLKEYSYFSPLEDKDTLTRLSDNFSPFWDLNNGETLCIDCHKKEVVVR